MSPADKCNFAMWDDVSTAEVDLSDEAIRELKSISWALPLINRLTEKETRGQDRALLFEIRFAYALHQAGHAAKYECPGLGASTIDFQVITPDCKWKIELVSLFESDSVQAATKQIGPYREIALTDTPGLDRSDSNAGEMIKAEEKIGEKVFSKSKPTKFPDPSKAIHVIVADMRGYLGIAAHVVDNYDYLQIANGPVGLPDHFVQWWGNRPVMGLFQKKNPTKAALYIRERVHVLAFICERVYTQTEVCSQVFCVGNQNLFTSADQLRAALRQFPVRLCNLALYIGNN